MADSDSHGNVNRSDDVRLCRMRLWSNFDGFGFEIRSFRRQLPHVSSVKFNSPAAAAGLRIRDVIFMINNQDTSQVGFVQLTKMIQTAREVNHSMEMLVVQQSIYEKLKANNIRPECLRPKIIDGPTTMPANFIEFLKNVPRLCKMRFARSDTTFGFSVVNGKFNRGLYIQMVLAGSIASRAGLRNNDRIIKIDGEDVADNASDSIRSKLDRARKRGKLKLFVVDTQAFEHFQRQKLQLRSNELEYHEHVSGITTSEGKRFKIGDVFGRVNTAIHATVLQPLRKNSTTTLPSDGKMYSVDMQSIVTKSTLATQTYGTRSADTMTTSEISAPSSQSDGDSSSIDFTSTIRSNSPDGNRRDARCIQFIPNRDITRRHSVAICSWSDIRSTSASSAYQMGDAESTFSLTDATQLHHSSINLHTVNETSTTSHTYMQVGNGTIRIRQGDLTQHPTHALVVSSSSFHLTEDILQQAGDPVRRAFLAETQKKPGQSVSTSGGQLLCKQIFFIPCPQLSDSADKSIFRNFIREAIVMATKDDSTAIQSLAIPAIGCGRYNYNCNFVARTLIMAVVYQLEKRPSLKLDVCFVVQPNQENAWGAFQEELIVLKTKESPYTNNFFRADASSASSQLMDTYYDNSGFVVDKLVLDRSSAEHRRVEDKFWCTMTTDLCEEIITVELVCNLRWYKQYEIHRDEFRQRLNDNTEKLLFHGCSESAATSIIEGCFNRSHAGRHGTLYGHGIYFSSTARYSHLYTQSNESGERCMFLARVLIGKTTAGDSLTKVCPIGYDTTTNGSDIYVVYHDAQAFGQYLITYK